MSTTTRMPLNLYDTHQTLWQQTADQNILWNEYKKLFGDKGHVQLLNDSAPVFFARVQLVFEREILFTVARMLLDPAKTGSYDNLCLEYLATLIPEPNLKTAVIEDITNARKQAEPIKKMRDKILAHNDLATTQGASQLQPVLHKDIDAALTAIRDIMNKVELHYDNSTTGYEHSVPALNSAAGLIGCLKDAQTFRKSKKNQS